MTQIPKGRLSPPPPQDIALALKISTLTVEWLAGDGSDRCYYRVFSPDLKNSLVLMQLSGRDLECLKKGSYDWIGMSKLLSKYDICAPQLVTELKEQGAIIIEDYGDLMLETFALQELKSSKGECPGNVQEKYREALDIVSKFISIAPASPPHLWQQRAFDQERFDWELKFFETKYLEGVAQVRLSSSQKTAFYQDIGSLSAFLAADSKFFTHRDFHSRNLMIFNDQLAVIDFQDARLGPQTYDLVSLIFDSYVPLSHHKRMDFLEEGLEIINKSIKKRGHLATASSQWKPMLLQRQLKAIGSFGYLTIDKQKGDYLKNVAPALLTLVNAQVYDERWPFLSGELLEILGQTLPS